MTRFSILLAVTLIASACASKKPVPQGPTKPLVEKPKAVEPETTDTEELFQCAGPLDGDWAMFQHDASRRGSVDYPVVASPRVVWSNEIGIAGWLNNPIVAADTVIAPSSGLVWNKSDGADGVYALALDTGELNWFYATGNDANAVAYARCRVFVTSDDGSLAALDVRSGEELWSHSHDGKLYSNPLIVDDLIVVGGASGELIAYTLRDGKEIWRKKIAGTVRGGASADADRIYVATEQRSIYALDPGTGESIWRMELDAPSAKAIYAAPTVHDGVVYVPFVRDTSYQTPAIRALEAATGRTLWTGGNRQAFDGGWGNVRSSPALYDNRLFWGEPYSNRLVAASTSDGEVTQSIAAGHCTFPHWPSPAVAQDTVYLPRHDGGLYAVDATSGAVTWKLYLGDAKSISSDFPPEFGEKPQTRCQWEPPFGDAIYASPAVARDGTIIVATGDGWVHAIRDQPTAAVE